MGDSGRAPTYDRGVARDSILADTASTLASRRQASEQLLAEARAGAERVTAETELALERLSLLQLARLRELRASLRSRSDEIELGYARLAEAFAGVSARLLRDAAEADYSAPEWPQGLAGKIELRLTETRELTLTLARDRAAPR